MGYLYLEYSTNNAILRTFIALLNRKGAGHATPTSRKPYSIQNQDSTAEMTLPANIDTADTAEIVPAGTDTIESKESSEDEAEKATLLADTAHAASQCSPSPLKLRPQIRSTRARNRWLVAYTLLRNPRLQLLTANRLILDGNMVRKHYTE